MLLSQIREYLKKKRDSASLYELSIAVGSEKSAVEMALKEWIAKGKVEVIKTEAPCKGCSMGSCSSCGVLPDKWYRWHED